MASCMDLFGILMLLHCAKQLLVLDLHLDLKFFLKPALLLHSQSALLGYVELCSPALVAPSHLVLATCLFEHLESVEIFHSDQLLVEVLTKEFIVGAEAEDLFLFELAHQDLLHLAMRQLSIVVETKGLNPAILILFKLHLMLDDLDTCLEDTLVLPGLSDRNLTSPRA